MFINCGTGPSELLAHLANKVILQFKLTHAVMHAQENMSPCSALPGKIPAPAS